VTKFHTHTKQQAILYIFIFIFLDSKLEDERFCTEWIQSVLKLIFCLCSFVSLCRRFGETGLCYLETVDQGVDWTENRSSIVSCSGLNGVLYHSAGDSHSIADGSIYRNIITVNMSRSQ
jgi:hypothetical protein